MLPFSSTSAQPSNAWISLLVDILCLDIVENPDRRPSQPVASALWASHAEGSHQRVWYELVWQRSNWHFDSTISTSERLKKLNNEWPKCALLRTAERHLDLAYISSRSHRISDLLRWFTSRVDGLNLSIDLWCVWCWKSTKSKFTTNMTLQDTQKNIKKRIECGTTCTLR